MLKAEFSDVLISSKEEAVEMIYKLASAISRQNLNDILSLYDTERGIVFIPNTDMAPIITKAGLRIYYEKLLNQDNIIMEMEEDNWVFPIIDTNSLVCVAQMVMSIQKTFSQSVDVVKATFVFRKTPMGLRITSQQSNYPVYLSARDYEEAQHREPSLKHLQAFGKDSLHRTYKSVFDATPTLRNEIL